MMDPIQNNRPSGMSQTTDLKMGSFRLAVLKAVTVLVLLLILSAPAFSGSWYKGDLHTHSNYSDGDSPVGRVVQDAEQKGLDFFAITDHDDMMNGNPVHWYDPEYQSDQMVLIYGVEWTSLKGHANIWATKPFEYEILWQANRNRDAETAVAEAHRQGALFSICHPMSFAGYLFGWEYDLVEGVDVIEVWNSMYNFPMFNFLSVRVLWDGLLQKGRRIPGVGGSDMHHLEKIRSFLYGTGNPTTWVYAETHSAESILAAIQQGNVSISYSPTAPRLDFSADEHGAGKFRTMTGQSILRTGTPVSFKIELHHEAPLKNNPNMIYEISDFNEDRMLQWLETVSTVSRLGTQVYLALVVKDGNAFRAWLTTAGSEPVVFQDIPSHPGYYRVELYGMPDVNAFQYPFYGNMIALTNPIYVD